jgi:hypothetical protein
LLINQSAGADLISLGRELRMEGVIGAVGLGANGCTVNWAAF